MKLSFEDVLTLYVALYKTYLNELVDQKVFVEKKL